MAQQFDIRKVTVGPRTLEAVVFVSPDAPLMTSEDPEGTERVLAIMPGLVDHVCLGDASPSFGEVVADTELAHLLEHVTVELLAQTDIAGDISSGQTEQVDERTYQITLSCVDDVLVAGALSSAVWILEWAYSGGGEPEPDVGAIASGLVGLVESLGDDSAEDEGADAAGAEDDPANVEPAPEQDVPEPQPSLWQPAEAEAPVEEYQAPAPDETVELEPVANEEPLLVADEVAAAEPEPLPAPAEDLEPVEEAPDPAETAEPELTAEPEPEPEPPAEEDPWAMNDVPRPHLVR